MIHHLSSQTQFKNRREWLKSTVKSKIFQQLLLLDLKIVSTLVLLENHLKTLLLKNENLHHTEKQCQELTEVLKVEL